VRHAWKGLTIPFCQEGAGCLSSPQRTIQTKRSERQLQRAPPHPGDEYYCTDLSIIPDISRGFARNLRKTSYPRTSRLLRMKFATGSFDTQFTGRAACIPIPVGTPKGPTRKPGHAAMPDHPAPPGRITGSICPLHSAHAYQRAPPHGRWTRPIGQRPPTPSDTYPEPGVVGRARDDNRAAAHRQSRQKIPPTLDTMHRL